MKAGEHTELKTTSLQKGKDKMQMYFRDDISDQLFPADKLETCQNLSIILNLVSYHTPEAIHGLTLAEKLG